MHIQIRLAAFRDAHKISVLIRAVAHYFTLDPEGKGAEGFFKTTTAMAICSYISNPLYNYLVAESEQDLAGVIAIKDNSHIYHLFVAPMIQRQGIATRLWSRAKTMAVAAGNPGYFTVNATPYALPMYQKFGFIIAGPRLEKNGIAVIPMRLDLDEKFPHELSLDR